MTFGRSIATCFSKYATFRGRASRSEFWWWQLFVVLFPGACFLIGFFLAGAIPLLSIIPLIGMISCLVFIIPTLAVTIRRLHDTGRSGLTWFVQFIPFIGPIILWVFLLQCSDDDEYNPYD